MEVTPTFGAIGDFISIALLIKDVVSALDECRGSAKAYRDLIEEIGLLQKSIEQIERIYQKPEFHDGVEGLESVVQATIIQVRKCLEGFCDRFCKKFGESLAEGGSGNALKDIAKKIQWKFEEKEVEKFRSEVVGYRMSLEMFLQVTMVYFLQKNHNDMKAQLSEVERNTTTAVRWYSRGIEAYLSVLGSGIFSRLDFVSKLGVDLKNSASQIITMMFTISGDLSIIRAMVMQLNRGVDNGEHFVLEDATGRTFPIHLKTIVSWEAFNVILNDRFKGKKGERRTRRKLYSLHESASHQPIDQSISFTDAFVPYQKVDMSLICKAPTSNDGDSGLSSCPWCRTVSPGTLGARVQCALCRKDFIREVIEANDVDDTRFTPSSPKSQGVQSRKQLSTGADCVHEDGRDDEPCTECRQLKVSKGGKQKGAPMVKADEESDEENLAGLAHVTLRTIKIRLPEANLNPLPRLDAFAVDSSGYRSLGGKSGNVILNRPTDEISPKVKQLHYWNEEVDKIEATNGKQGKPLVRARLRLLIAKLQVQILTEEGDVEQAKAGLQHAIKLVELSDGQSPSDHAEEEMKELGSQLMSVIERIGICGLHREDLDHL